MQHIQADDSASYKKRTKGFVLPFNTIDKDYTNSDNDLVKNFKTKHREDIDEIKQQVAMIKRRREREKLQEIFEAKLRYEKSRKYIKQAHERFIRERNSREPKINNTAINPYDDNPLDSARDHLYLIIPTNPSTRFKNK